MSKNRHENKHTVGKAARRGIFRFLIANPVVLVVLLVIISGIVAYLIYSANYQLDEIMRQYQSLSARTDDSKAEYDKKMFYITTDENGNTTIHIGYASEEAEEAAKQSAEEAGVSTDPNQSGGGDPNVNGNQISKTAAAEKIIGLMRSAGYNDYAISAALGNFVAESGLNPSTTQGHKMDGASNSDLRNWAGVGGRAIGFAQWDKGRATALLNAADSAGKKWDDFDFQVNYYIADLNSNGCSVSKFNSNATDIEHATFWFTHAYERCGISKNCPGYSSSNKYAASQVSYDERQYCNGWGTRLQSASDFYVTYFN